MRTVLVRDNIAAAEANGWSAFLCFEPNDCRVFTDCTYIAIRPPAPATAPASSNGPLIVSSGSLPPASGPTNAATVDREGMKFGHMRTRAMGTKIFGHLVADTIT